MHKTNAGFALIAAAVLALSAAVQAQAPEPLTGTQLRRCAGRVQTLRAESARLNAAAKRLDARRAALARRRAALGDNAADDRHARWMHYNADAAALNKDVAQFRQDVARVNRIKQAYAETCAGRPYARADLQNLPEALRAAMRAGLADVQVPYAGEADAPAGQSPHR